jgi:hypothetical protein
MLPTIHCGDVPGHMLHHLSAKTRGG